MVDMSLNHETILDELTNFEKQKNVSHIPDVLDKYLELIAANGETIFAWSKLQPLLRRKLEIVLNELNERNPTESLPQLPNCEPFDFDDLKTQLLESIESFPSAPFTIQRICEMITNPNKHYKRTDKFMRAVEKNMRVVSACDTRVMINANETIEESSKYLNMFSPVQHAYGPSSSPQSVSYLVNGLGDPKLSSHHQANNNHGSSVDVIVHDEDNMQKNMSLSHLTSMSSHDQLIPLSPSSPHSPPNSQHLAPLQQLDSFTTVFASSPSSNPLSVVSDLDSFDSHASISLLTATSSSISSMYDNKDNKSQPQTAHNRGNDYSDEQSSTSMVNKNQNLFVSASQEMTSTSLISSSLTSHAKSVASIKNEETIDVVSDFKIDENEDKLDLDPIKSQSAGLEISNLNEDKQVNIVEQSDEVKTQKEVTNNEENVPISAKVNSLDDERLKVNHENELSDKVSGVKVETKQFDNGEEKVGTKLDEDDDSSMPIKRLKVENNCDLRKDNDIDVTTVALKDDPNSIGNCNLNVESKTLSSSTNSTSLPPSLPSQSQHDQSQLKSHQTEIEAASLGQTKEIENSCEDENENEDTEMSSPRDDESEASITSSNGSHNHHALSTQLQQEPTPTNNISTYNSLSDLSMKDNNNKSIESQNLIPISSTLSTTSSSTSSSTTLDLSEPMEQD